MNERSDIRAAGRMPDASAQIPALSAGRAQRPHLAVQTHRKGADLVAPWTCVTATGRSPSDEPRPEGANVRPLVDIGLKEVEIASPSASKTELNFTRWLIEEGEGANDVSLQVLVQCPGRVDRAHRRSSHRVPTNQSSISSTRPPAATPPHLPQALAEVEQIAAHGAKSEHRT